MSDIYRKFRGQMAAGGDTQDLVDNRLTEAALSHSLPYSPLLFGWQCAIRGRWYLSLA